MEKVATIIEEQDVKPQEDVVKTYMLYVSKLVSAMIAINLDLADIYTEEKYLEAMGKNQDHVNIVCAINRMMNESKLIGVIQKINPGEDDYCLFDNENLNVLVRFLGKKGVIDGGRRAYFSGHLYGIY